MVKKTAPIFNDTYDDYIEPEPLNIKTTSDIIYYYENAVSEDDLDLVYDAVLDFNIDIKIENFHNDIHSIYKDVIEEFIYHDAPTHIFDTGLHNNLMTNFIEYVYTNSIKGNELNYVKEIEDEYNEKQREIYIKSLEI